MMTRFWAATVSLSITSIIALWMTHHLQKTRKMKKNSQENDPTKISLPSHLQREAHKAARRTKMIPKLARKGKMYDNVQMLDPQGVLLCNISKKKAIWYIQKNLAYSMNSEFEEDDNRNNPFQIKLLFDPKGNSSRGVLGIYIKSPKANVCVSCGNGGHHMKHYIVPYSYRMLFPAKYKSHMSHDVVILCPNCHLHCDQETQHQQKHLEDAVRTNPASALAFQTNHTLYQVRSMALALLRWKAKLPLNTIEEYEELVRNHLQMDPSQDLTPELLQQAIDVEYKVSNKEYIPGAKLVVNSLVTTDLIESFVRDWRQHFCAVVQPRFLPEGWSVDSPVSSEHSEL